MHTKQHDFKLCKLGKKNIMEKVETTGLWVAGIALLGVHTVIMIQ